MLPGPPIQANYVATNAQIAPSLGRNLGQCSCRGDCSGTFTVDPDRAEHDVRIAITSSIFGWVRSCMSAACVSRDMSIFTTH